MGAYQAFISLPFQGQLRQADKFAQVDILYFREMLEGFGLDAATVPTYTVTGDVDKDGSGIETGREVWLKVRSGWTPLYVETRTRNVFVIHKRKP